MVFAIFVCRSIQIFECFLPKVVDALKIVPHSNGKTQGSYPQAQFGFDFVQQIKGIFSLSIQFIDKNLMGILRMRQTSTSFRFALHTLGNIYDHDHTVHGSQRPKVSSAKSLARRVKNIDLFVFIVKGEYRSG